MTFSNPQVEESVRQAFKHFNRFMLLMWRLGLGGWLNAWPEKGGRILVLAHTGRKTGQRRLTPLNYALVDGELYCTAGFGAAAHWYRNLLAHPQGEVWLPGEHWAVVAADITDHPDKLALLRNVLKGSGIVAPLLGVDPHTLSDADLERLTNSYRLVHLRRTQRLDPPVQPGDPGDLVWVWPWIALAFAGLWLAARRRR